MADDDFYQLLPTNEFESVKEEIEKLKKEPNSYNHEKKELSGSIEKLNKSINSLLMVFKKASDYFDNDNTTATLSEMKMITENTKTETLSRLDDLSVKMEKVAKAMIRISDQFEKNKSIENKVDKILKILSEGNNKASQNSKKPPSEGFDFNQNNNSNPFEGNMPKSDFVNSVPPQPMPSMSPGMQSMPNRPPMPKPPEPMKQKKGGFFGR